MKKITLKKGLLIGYLLVLVWILLFKMSTTIGDIANLSNTIRNVNLIPFKESTIVNGQIHFSEIFNNLLIFVPFGGLLGIVDKKLSFTKKSLIFLTFSFIIETLQYIFGLGVSDITDLLANTLGGIIGLLIYYLLKSVFREDKLDRVLVEIGTAFFSICLAFICFILFIN